MALIHTTPVADAAGEVRELYVKQQSAWGYVPNYAKVFSHRPEVLTAWAALLSTLRAPVDKRTFELVTFVAAYALGSTSCSLAHGKRLADLVSVEDVIAIAAGEEEATTLTPAEIAMTRLTRKVVLDASSVDADDIAALRQAGVEDQTIFDIVAIAAGRAFFADLIEALGSEPDAKLGDGDQRLVDALTIGRPSENRPGERLIDQD